MIERACLCLVRVFRVFLHNVTGGLRSRQSARGYVEVSENFCFTLQDAVMPVGNATKTVEKVYIPSQKGETVRKGLC